ncbi:Hypothetical predicted protein [Lecanosticta acicola]|uniref:J domain-containing protein n=1 Tax=Lecanosticta acicola TaxID=111012 RepID=A0AAI9EFQ7_9PEZI|nr:Hypothetical predicted protein [Lecanosticta acicola]
MANATHYQLLRINRDAPTSIVLEAYEQRVKNYNAEHMIYGEPTAKDKEKKERGLAELHAAVKVLTHGISREKYDRRLRELTASPTIPRASKNQHPRLDKSRHDHYDLYPDTWIARRDGRVRSDGQSWAAPPPPRAPARRRPSHSRYARSRPGVSRHPTPQSYDHYEPYANKQGGRGFSARSTHAPSLRAPRLG